MYLYYEIIYYIIAYRILHSRSSFANTREQINKSSLTSVHRYNVFRKYINFYSFKTCRFIFNQNITYRCNFTVVGYAIISLVVYIYIYLILMYIRIHSLKRNITRIQRTLFKYCNDLG